MEIAMVHGAICTRNTRPIVPQCAFDFPAYAQIQAAAIVGRVTTGARAGARVMRLGRAADEATAARGVSLHSHLGGFDLHAGVWVPAGDRARLEHLCRYILRPPLAQRSLTLVDGGDVVLRLRRPWRDGTTAIRFAPSELLERLAAMVPKPRINLLIYHGVFAPHAYRRAAAVRQAREGPTRQRDCQATGIEASAGASAGSGSGSVSHGSDGSLPGHAAGVPVSIEFSRGPPSEPYRKPSYARSADLLERTFEIDILACPGCGGRLRLIATIEERAVIEKILGHLGLPTAPPRLAPARRSAEQTNFDFPA